MSLTPRLIIRSANRDDLEQLLSLEKLSFPAHRQSSRRSIYHTLTSLHQRCIVIEDQNDQSLCGAMVCFLYRKTLRIYSIAVIPTQQGEGLGGQLIDMARQLAHDAGLTQLTLEVDATNERLCKWYLRQGFVQEGRIKDYYASGQDAYKMKSELLAQPEQNKIKTLVITYHPKLWISHFEHVQVLSPKAYLSDPSWQKREGLRVINLCAPYRDQRLGYYTSLLGVARNHRVIPNVIMIKDLSRPRLNDLFPYEADQALQRYLNPIDEDKLSFLVIFERCADLRLAPVAKLLARYIEVPLFRVWLEKILVGPRSTQDIQSIWRVKRAQPLTLAQVIRLEPQVLAEAAPIYLNRQRFHKQGVKHEKYDLAILIDPNESTPPSCEHALEKLRSAAEKIGFYVEFITIDDTHRISEFDALFIRTTTQVNHPTYKISRLATTEGLVVIDNP